MKTFATLLLCVAASAANAQPVYRCGNAYSGAPCGAGTMVDASDERTPAQRDQAMRVAAEEARMGSGMERQRLASLSAQKPAQAVSLSGTPAKPAELRRAKKLKWVKIPKAKAPAGRT